jgi:hypothetical protein
LRGETNGYRQHPQLERFKASRSPVVFIDTYLYGLSIEADKRGYKFDHAKIGPQFTRSKLYVSDGQLAFEFDHLKNKLIAREPKWLASLPLVAQPDSHPLFKIVSGDIEDWERIP